jgi:hypothetical protein
MESLLQGAGWRLWLLLLIPLAAGTVALGTALNDPPEYRATATILTPTPFDSPATPQVTSQAVSNLQGVIASEAFIEDVARETGERAATVRDGLSNSRFGLANVVDLTFTHIDPQVVETVIDTASARAVTLLTQGDAERVSSEERLAEQEYNASDLALNDLLASLGTVDPEGALRDAIGRLAEDDSGVGGPSLEQLRAEVAALQADVIVYQRARNERDAAFENLVDIRQRKFGILAVAEASPEAFIVGPTEAVELSKRLPVARTVITVSGIAFALAIGLVVLLQVVAPRTPGRHEDAGDTIGANPTG